jgi:ATP-binding cassette, subfamily B, bacterial PglK
VSPLFHEYGILNLLLHLWRHLSLRRRRQFWLVLGLMLVSALAEVVSLGAVLPFLSILISPDKVFNHHLARDVLQALEITSAQELVLPLTIGFVLLALVGGAIRMLLLWVSSRLAYASGTDFSIEMYQRTLYQPYSVHVARNSSEMISNVVNKVNTAVTVLSSLLILASSVLIVLAITFTLIAVDPKVALIAATSFGVSYVLITWLLRNRLKRNSQRVAHEQTRVIKALQEGLGGIRDVLLDGTQQAYCNIYRQAEYPLKRAIVSNLFIGGSPRFAMEVMGITLIAAIAYGLSNSAGGLAPAIPTLGALVLGTQRLLPALQHGYYSWTTILGGYTSLEDVVELLDQPMPESELQTGITPLSFQDTICFNDVRFRYSSDGPWVLDGLNFTVSKGIRLGIVGSTGSGKSTALDLLMGLLLPVEGEILVDDQAIKGERVRSWQRTIAHVPQSIYLADSTVAENIAFGVPFENIDMERVKQVARQAQISEFIEDRDKGYMAVVGERGICISGGQRQRIGIARALYKQANVLVFDEATSALDNETEQSVMRSIKELNRNFTIFLIAHRLTTIQDCDFIIELENGRIVAQGTYEYLLESSPSFRRKALVQNKVDSGC